MKTGSESQFAQKISATNYDAQLIKSSKSWRFYRWWHESKITNSTWSLLVVAYTRALFWQYKKSARQGAL